MKRILAACLGLFVVATSIHAAQPLQNKWSNYATWSESCGAYDVIFEQETSLHITFFFTNDGTLLRGRLHVQADIEIYREGNPDDVLLGRRNNVQHATFENGIITGVEVMGVVIQVMLPGYGHLYFDTGHTYLDGDMNVVHLRGANHDYFLGQTDALCAYFQ